jgi:hypothetical protein
MAQPLTARQSLEQSLEDYSAQNEGQSSGFGLQQLTRSAVQDQVGKSFSVVQPLFCCLCRAPWLQRTRAQPIQVCYDTFWSLLQTELIKAAQEDRAHRVKLKKASKQQAACAAEALFEAPSGLTAFANKLLQVMTDACGDHASSTAPVFPAGFCMQQRTVSLSVCTVVGSAVTILRG